MDARQDAELARRTARVWQPALCLGLLASLSLSWVSLQALVRDDRLGARLDEAWARLNDTANEYARLYQDTEDRIMLQDLQELDPSRGGVYFFGSSNMKWAMRTPDLPPEEKRLVHDLAAGEGKPYWHRQFTEFLVRRKGILRAGPKKTLIVYGTSFLNAEDEPLDASWSVFPHLWSRYGLYAYDPERGVTPAADGTVWGPYVLAKARGASFVHGLIERAGRLAVPKALRRRNTSKDAAVYAAEYESRMGPRWREQIAEQRAELQDWYGFVHAQGAGFAVVLLPLASWHRTMPYPPVYRAMIRDFCAKNRVSLVDMSGLLSDDEFLDHIHANAKGLVKTDTALMGLARRFLTSTGAWPREPASSMSVSGGR